MPKAVTPLPRWLPACAFSLMMLAGCATPTPPNVGRVVVAPMLTLPPVPLIVQQTAPKSAGYFQQSFLDYFSNSRKKPTP